MTLLHKNQFTVLVSCSDELAVRSCPAPLTAEVGCETY